MVTEQVLIAFNWASWGSILAGVAAALAVSMVMWLLGIALGFKKIHPTNDEPFSGLGATLGIWFFVSVMVSALAGGLVAGLFAVQRGGEHGFMVWAVSLILAGIFTCCALGSAARGAGRAARGLGHGVAGVAHGMAGAAQGVGHGAARLAKGAWHAGHGVVDELREHIHVDIDKDKLNADLTGILRDTGVEALQPEYLRSQLREARMELRGLIHELTMNPRQYDELISKFLDTQKGRLENLAEGVDRNAAVKALMKARDISEEDASKLVDNGIEAYEQVVAQAKESLAEVRGNVEMAKGQLKDMADRAREKAEKFSNGLAKVSVGAAVSLIIAAFVCTAGGVLGNWLAFCLYGVTRTIIS